MITGGSHPLVALLALLAIVRQVSGQQACDPNDGWCSNSGGLPPNAIRVIVSFLTLFLCYWLRQDRMLSGILLMWNASMLVFAFSQSLFASYVFVFIDLYMMSKYLEQKRLKKLADAAAQAEGENGDGESDSDGGGPTTNINGQEPPDYDDAADDAAY